MNKETKMIADDNGCEVIVGYNYEKTKDIHDTDEGVICEPLVYTELTSVELVMNGRGIDVLSQMHPAQKEWVISKLYE